MSTFIRAAISACLIIAIGFSTLVLADKNHPIVVLETTAGNIAIEVYPDKAPRSVASFLLAVESQLFENGGGTFYRVVYPENDIGTPIISVIQAGVTDAEKALPLIAHETTQQTGLLHKEGTVSLGRAPNSTGSGSLFFICIGDQPSLDYGGARYKDGEGFAAFGKVVKGMDVVRRIQRMKTKEASSENRYAQQALVTPVEILRAYRK